MASDSSSIAEGMQLYKDYQCGECHGADAKSSKTANVPKLAGMNAHDLSAKTMKFLASRTHESVMKECGETPNNVQVKKISEFIAGLPR